MTRQQPPLTPPPLDGPLARKRAQMLTAIVEAMAQDLVRYAAFSEERAAIRTLSGRGYGQGQIIGLVDAARARAAELVVAHEMAKP